ncbi:MAG: hypothetical protein ABI693_27200 [Bryobacteraceae bacterium]
MAILSYRKESPHRSRQDRKRTFRWQGHLDGKVIVPDEPLHLLPNQALILQIQTVSGQIVPAEDSALAWIAANAIDSDALPVDLADRHDHYLYGRSSYRSRGDKDWSLTDCLSFVVMERPRLTEALTTDHHFEQAAMKALMLSLPSL